MTFTQVPPADPLKLLPNLPSGGDEPERQNCLDLFLQLQCYPPEQRMRPENALRHPLFAEGLPLLLPLDHPTLVDRGQSLWAERLLADVLGMYL